MYRVKPRMGVWYVEKRILWFWWKEIDYFFSEYDAHLKILDLYKCNGK